MARITVEDCLKQVENRFQLVHLAARRVRQLRGGAPTLSDRDNKDVVLALREIASTAISLENVNEHEPQPREELDLIEDLGDAGLDDDTVY
ncbi:MAG: DNA-directed RNA polymerase subunit omega [Proteobacteria bacterium]|nr:DNA-directed RNA polymerase subunit omega [Pseudomonadota bacterium]